jgi:endonuclease YncB( thermonuclease family)
LIRYLISLLFAFPAYAGMLEGRVVSVAGGDTVTILDSQKRQHKIRL